jgi:hypothetical protein
MKTWCGAVMSHEFRDEAAVKWLTMVAPDLLVKMPAAHALLPQFDDHENICSMEMFSEAPPVLALVFYIRGNREEKYNGWIIRIFPGLRHNDDRHIALHQNFQKLSGAMHQTIDQF